MAKQVITSDKLYPVYGPYSHAVRVGDMIFLHGTVGFDPQGQLPGDTPGRADMARQCEQTIANMTTALELLGGGLQDVVKVRAFLPQHCRPARPGQRSFDATFDEVYGRHVEIVATDGALVCARCITSRDACALRRAPLVGRTLRRYVAVAIEYRVQVARTDST